MHLLSFLSKNEVPPKTDIINTDPFQQQILL